MNTNLLWFSLRLFRSKGDGREKEGRSIEWAKVFETSIVRIEEGIKIYCCYGD